MTAWRDVLGVAPCDPDALTIAEIAEQCGLHPLTAWRRVRVLLREGKAVATLKVVTVAGGHRRRLPAYKLVAPNKSKRAA